MCPGFRPTAFIRATCQRFTLRRKEKLVARQQRPSPMPSPYPQPPAPKPPVPKPPVSRPQPLILLHRRLVLRDQLLVDIGRYRLVVTELHAVRSLATAVRLQPRSVAVQLG